MSYKVINNSINYKSGHIYILTKDIFKNLSNITFLSKGNYFKILNDNLNDNLNYKIKSELKDKLSSLIFDFNDKLFKTFHKYEKNIVYRNEFHNFKEHIYYCVLEFKNMKKYNKFRKLHNEFFEKFSNNSETFKTLGTLETLENLKFLQNYLCLNYDITGILLEPEMNKYGFYFCNNPNSLLSIYKNYPTFKYISNYYDYFNNLKNEQRKQFDRYIEIDTNIDTTIDIDSKLTESSDNKSSDNNSSDNNSSDNNESSPNNNSELIVKGDPLSFIDDCYVTNAFYVKRKIKSSDFLTNICNLCSHYNKQCEQIAKQTVDPIILSHVILITYMFFSLCFFNHF